MPKRPFIPIWAKVPFSRITIPFALGIAMADAYTLNLHATRLLCAGCLVVLALLHFILPRHLLFIVQPAKGACLCLMLLLCGMLTLQNQQDPHSPDWYGHVRPPIIAYTGVVTAPATEKKKTWQTTVELLEVIRPGWIRQRVSGKMLLYLSKKGGVLPSTGNLIQFYGQPQVVQNSLTPGRSDRKKGLARQNIYEQLFLDSGYYSLKKNSYREGRGTILLEEIRHWIVRHLQNSIGGSQESALAEALFIGYREDLDPDLLQAYANTGVIHVIAISGLHLSLIYSLLSLGLQLLMGRKKNSLVYLLLILSGVWAFSLIAGCSPSILRAAVMFSLGAAGPFLCRRNQTLNHVLASAFVLLGIHPYWLFNLGFQLSYGAILSLLLFYKPLFRSLYVKNPILLASWQLTAMTLAAQVLTVPIILFTFHQWPMYFLITNLVAVPLSSILLVGILLLCAAASFPALANVLGHGLHQGIFLLNSWVRFWEHRPFSVGGPIPFSGSQAVWIYLLIAIACLLYSTRKRSLIYLPLIALLGWVSNRNITWRETRQQKKLMVYATQGGALIDLYAGHIVYTYLSGKAAPEQKIDRTLKLVRAEHAIQQWVQLQKTSGMLKISVDSTDLFFLHHNPEKWNVSPTRSLVIILLKDCAVDPALLQHQSQIRQVIITAGCSPQQITTWQRRCRALHLPCFDVQQNASFAMTLR